MSQAPHRSSAPSEEDSATHASEEAIDALPVLAQEAAPLQARAAGVPMRSSPTLVIPAVQAAAAAAGGFVAGAAFVGLVQRHQRRVADEKARRGRRRLGRSQRANSKAGELVQIVGSRSLLVDVHLLGER